MLCKQNLVLFCVGVVVLTLSIFLFGKYGRGIRPIAQPSTRVEEKQKFQYSGPWDRHMFDGFYLHTEPLPDHLPVISGGIVPHHLLAGYIPATFFSALSKQQPSTIVIVSPNHFYQGRGDIITSLRDWQTPYGVVQTDRRILTALLDKQSIEVNEGVIKEEHGVYGLIPFIKKSLPQTKVLVFSLRQDTSNSTLDEFVAHLNELLPRDTVVVASIDFSHYQNNTAADFHDELSMSVIKNFDYERLPKLEIDSVPSLYVLLKRLESVGAKHVAYELHTNSAVLSHNLFATNITSYYSPYFTGGTARSEQVVSVLSFGDIMLDRLVAKRIETHGPEYILGSLAGEEKRFFRGVDIIQANLEGPFADSRRETKKTIAFQFDPLFMPLLQSNHIFLVTLANNHSFDMGQVGFDESKANLTKAGIDFYGSQYVVDDDSYIVKKVGNKHIAFIGVNDTNAPVDETAVKKLIERGESEADITVINIHWGVEYKDTSSERQRYLAHLFIDEGADAVIGHHPHVVEEMEVYKNRPIFYSLGNFIFDQYFSKRTQEGLGVGLVFLSTHISVYLFPLAEHDSAVSLMPKQAAESFLNTLVDRSTLKGYSVKNFEFTIPITSYGQQ